MYSFLFHFLSRCALVLQLWYWSGWVARVGDSVKTSLARDIAEALYPGYGAHIYDPSTSIIPTIGMKISTLRLLSGWVRCPLRLRRLAGFARTEDDRRCIEST